MKHLAIALCAATALACHGYDVPAVTALTPDTHTPNFPINASAGPHAITDCNTCHGGTISFRQFSCTNGTCHPQAEAAQQHATVVGFDVNGVSCYGCHPSGVGKGSPDHTMWFPIGATQTHGFIACIGCHQDPDTRKTVSCAIEGCHGQAPMQTKHAAVANYMWTTDACLSCHPMSTIPGK
jgi:hypothetical protein